MYSLDLFLAANDSNQVFGKKKEEKVKLIKKWLMQFDDM